MQVYEFLGVQITLAVFNIGFSGVICLYILEKPVYFSFFVMVFICKVK
jgi:hypothetical protein